MLQSLALALALGFAPPPTTDAETLLARSAVRTAYATPTAPGVTTTQYGSGTVVRADASKLVVLSCAHVCRHESGAAGRLTVMTHDGRWHPAKVLAVDPDADLSLMEVTLGAPCEVAVAKVAAGEGYKPKLAVVKVGFPLGGRRHVGRGEVLDVTSHHVRRPEVVVTVASAKARSGDSGGGLFRESDHALVGVVWGGREDGLRASRLADIQALLRKAKLKLE